VEILTWSCLPESSVYVYPVPHTIYVCYENVFVFLDQIIRGAFV